MGKVKETSKEVLDMHTRAKALLETSTYLKQQAEELLSATTALMETYNSEKDTGHTNPEPISPHTTAAKEITKEEVRGILAKLSAKGHGEEVRTLLSKYGANKLSELDSSDYTDVMKEAKEISNE